MSLICPADLHMWRALLLLLLLLLLHCCSCGCRRHICHGTSVVVHLSWRERWSLMGRIGSSAVWSHSGSVTSDLRPPDQYGPECTNSRSRCFSFIDIIHCQICRPLNGCQYSYYVTMFSTTSAVTHTLARSHTSPLGIFATPYLNVFSDSSHVA